MAERIRGAATFHAIADCVIAELADFDGVRGSALVLCDLAGEPMLWIGDGLVDRATAHAYIDGGFRDDALFARVRESYMAEHDGDQWVAPILGGDGVIGMLRVVVDRAVDRSMLTSLAAYISVRIAILGIALDPVRSAESLTPRQREVAELVAHGCTNHEIANMLAISANAVKKHVSRVLAALDVSNRTELAALTGRWRKPSTSHHVLPGTLHVVLRNPAKPVDAEPREEVA